MKHFLQITIALIALLQSCIRYDDLIAQGKMHYEKGNNAAAKNCFEQALDKDSTRADAYYGLGFLLAHQCRSEHQGCENAIQFFTQVIDLDSNFRHAYYNRSNCYIELEMYEQALNDLNTAISFSKQDADYCINRSICYLNLGDTSQAFHSYKMAIELDSNKKADYFELIFKKSGLK